MNKADPTPTDYNDLIARHIQIAKDICGNNSEAWSKFFKIITENDGAPGYLPARYAQRMRDRNCAGEIVDFCSFLYDYLKKDNCYVLTNLIKSRQTFFSEYFRSILKDAYAIFEKQYACEFAVIPIDGDVQRNLHEKLTAPAAAPVKRKLPTRTQRCYDTFRNVWKNNQLDYLTIYLGVALDFNYKYVAGLLGFGTANAVAKRVERFYRADGTLAAQELNDWLLHEVCLQFAPDSRAWQLTLHMPFCCHNKDICYIRLELRRKDGSYVRAATVKYGSQSCQIKNGWGELKLADFHKLVKKKKGSVGVVTSKGVLSEGFPVLQDKPPIRVLTNESFCDLEAKKADTLRFLADFGPGLAWLLDCNLDYVRYGAPEKFTYEDLGVVPGEALTLFAADCGDSGNNNSNHGFVFPLEWRYLPEYDNPYSSLLP